MANCNDIDDQLKQIEERMAAVASLKRGVQAQADLLDEAPGPRRTVKLRTYDGKEVLVNPREWAEQAEKDALRMGEDTVRQLVQEGFANGKGPNGRTGSMINYRLMAPDDEQVAVILKLMELERVETPKGTELRKPFTAQVAADALKQLGTALGNDPEQIAIALKNKVRGIDKLPSAIYMIGKARWDAASQYADALDELADAIDGGYLTEAMKTEAGHVARWAHFFEQMDAQVRRRVGQAMRSMQMGHDPSDPLIKLRDDLDGLTIEDIKGDTLVADMLKQVTEAKAKELRVMSAAKRANIALGINDTGWKRQLTLLNSLRRANLLSSLSTWMLRNPISGALVQGVYMAEDSLSGTLRLVNKNGLKAGVADGLAGAGYAFRGFNSAFSLSWGNFAETLSSGRSAWDNPGRLSDGANDYGALRNSKEIVYAAFNEAHDDITSWKGLANPLSVLNWINGGFWKVFGDTVERVTGSDAGYMATFRLLNATDDFMKTQAYAWKANHEAFVRAAEEGRAAGKTVEWIEKRADELAEGALYDGVLSDDQLARYRRAHAKDYGSALSDLSDDELRLQLYNQYKGVANTNSQIGQIGLKRALDSTFTGDVTGSMAPLVNGISQIRQNPFGAWAIPFWKVPVNGMGWVLNRDVIVGTTRYLLQEAQQIRSGRTAYTAEQMMDARARTAVAVTVAGLVYGLWENGLFTDGGSHDPRQRSRERRVWAPYSFTVQVGNVLAGSSGKGIDLWDLMGLQADVARAFHDGILSSNEAAAWNKPIVSAYANLLKNKAALKNFTSLLSFAQDPNRFDFGVVLGDQMGGLVPISGVIGNLTRSASDPEQTVAKRRYATAEERAALRKDPNYKLIEPVIDGLQVAADAFMRGNSGVFASTGWLPRERDWFGNVIERPLGLPFDLTIPFMPVIKPKDPTFQWLERHGFGDKPRPDGTFEMGGAKVQMTNEEEDFYREQMRTVKAEIPPEAIGQSAGRLMPIWQYVQGNDLPAAMRSLSRDPRYNQLLNDPTAGISPSLSVQKGESLASRKQSGGGKLYAPVDDIINYYDRLALMKLLTNERFDFRQRYQAVLRQKQQGLQQYAESINGMGVGRQ